MFKKGMKVKKILHYRGVTEEEEGIVTKVSKGVAYFNDEWGITFDAITGKELENFFLPMWSEIVGVE